MADRIHTEVDDAHPELVTLDTPEESNSNGLPPKEDKSKRRLYIVLGLIAAVVIYGLAFDYTEVDLSKTSSETRQDSLTRILRALAQPELVTYDTEAVRTTLDVAVPCGAPTPSSSVGSITVSPSCAAPGELITVSGDDFEPGENVQVNFVPDADFDITLPVARIQAEDDGSFSATFEAPERQSESTQQIEVVTRQRIGSWGDRVEVWTDTNENGVRDDPVLTGDGNLTVLLESATPEQAAVALIDQSRQTVEFVTFAEPFTATDGIANGETAVRPDEVDPARSTLNVVGVGAADGGTMIELSGPSAFDATSWRVALYDATTTEVVEVTAIVDQIELSPRISETTWISLDKILETVFLALVATTAGLLLAIPLSFISARNIMQDISSTVTNLALGIIAIPIGFAAGVAASRAARALTEPIRVGWIPDVAGIAVLSMVILFAIRWAIPHADEEIPSRSLKVQRRLVLIGAGLLGLVAFFLVADVFGRFGDAVAPRLGPFDFIAEFFSTIGELLEGLATMLAAIAGIGVLLNVAGKLGYGIRHRVKRPVLRVLNLVLGAAAGAVAGLGIAAALDWFYRFDSPAVTTWIPASIGAVIGLLIAVKGMATGQVNVGLTTYGAARTVFNTLRAIEPLVMAIVFVVWVGLGPFAGSLALTLHTAAALAKLYSEQVESIAPGPIEAVRATGANRLQTIVYAVVPQIVPPYISFTMYRWDINVRMSTILGFVGGGGIGFILQQNVNLLQYRAAAVQMLFIAIVVASMDYASSRLRQRFV